MQTFKTQNHHPPVSKRSFFITVTFKARIYKLVKKKALYHHVVYSEGMGEE